MGIQLSDDELTDYLTRAHTLILSTIRKSGEPFLTPIWFLYQDKAFFVRTLAKSPKVQHIRRDPRVCVMVEDGERWVDLRAVVANCDATFVTDEAARKPIEDALEAKYAGAVNKPEAMPSASTKHYAQSMVIIKLAPRPGELRSWYNRKLRGMETA